MKRLQAFWKFIIGDSQSAEILIQESMEQRMELERLLASWRAGAARRVLAELVLPDGLCQTRRRTAQCTPLLAPGQQQGFIGVPKEPADTASPLILGG